MRKQLDHAVKAGIDYEYGGVYVEGPHDGGPAYDTEKEFWQQAETLIGMLDGCLCFGMEPYWKAYEAVHRFVFDKMVNREVGEWWPLLSRDGNTRIWTHMGALVEDQLPLGAGHDPVDHPAGAAAGEVTGGLRPARPVRPAPLSAAACRARSPRRTARRRGPGRPHTRAP